VFQKIFQVFWNTAWFSLKYFWRHLIMIKTFGKTALAFLAIFALIVLAGCGEVDPTGSLIPAPGYPGGETAGSGGAFTVFDINNLPAPASWNKIGEYKNYPDPFLRANGTRISTQNEWTNPDTGRRAEIKKIIEYYYSGSYPPQPTNVEVSGPGVLGNGNLTITVTGNNRTASFTVNNLTLPTLAPNGAPPSSSNRVPLVLLVGASNQGYLENGYATVDFGANSDGLDGITQAIWPYSEFAPDRPSALVREAWKAARIIDAAEKGIGGAGGFIDPEKFLVTGMSRWGKDSAYIGIFAESMTGKHIAVGNPVSSGSGGISPDRFNAQAGGKKDYTYLDLADPQVGTPLIQLVPASVANAVSAGRTNRGYQTATHARGETRNWFGVRFQQFSDVHTNWITNYQSAVNPGNDPNSWHGYAATAPFDSHFLAALAAPYGLLIHDGWDSAWTNAESNYVAYLATREVYDFLEKPQNIGIRIYKIGHAQPAREGYDLVDFGNEYFKLNHPVSSSGYARLEGQVAYPVTPFAAFHDNDPNYTFVDADGERHLASWYDTASRSPAGDLEYAKLNWQAPGKPGKSIGEKVTDYFAAHPNGYDGTNGIQ
jgi:hypothetical protein